MVDRIFIFPIFRGILPLNRLRRPIPGGSVIIGESLIEAAECDLADQENDNGTAKR